MSRHGGNCAADDVLNASTPAGVHIGNDLPFGINQQNSLTIGNLNHQPGSPLIGHQGIADQCCRPACPQLILMAMIDNQNPITMDLLTENECITINTPGNDASVFRDAVIVISDAARDIETPERTLAVSSPAREYSMRNAAQSA
jgi:hypothetical protein